MPLPVLWHPFMHAPSVAGLSFRIRATDWFGSINLFDLSHSRAERPGDEIAVLGMSSAGLFSFKLPHPRLVVRARFDCSVSIEARPPIVTVLFEPEGCRFEVTVRRTFAQGRGQNVLRELHVDLDE